MARVIIYFFVLALSAIVPLYGQTQQPAGGVGGSPTAELVLNSAVSSLASKGIAVPLGWSVAVGKSIKGQPSYSDCTFHIIYVDPEGVDRTIPTGYGSDGTGGTIATTGGSSPEALMVAIERAIRHEIGHIVYNDCDDPDIGCQETRQYADDWAWFCLQICGTISPISRAELCALYNRMIDLYKKKFGPKPDSPALCPAKYQVPPSCECC